MFIPGYPPSAFPLARHLPPLAEGVCAAYAEQHSARGDLVIDPFGQSPRPAIELARAGRRVVLASPNPVLRFALINTLDPPPPKLLRAALTRLADARAGESRIETRLRDLYRSTCHDCGTKVDVDFFLWDRDALTEKNYYCEACGEHKLRPADKADSDLAAKHAPRGPHYYWALERLAPPDDPDRDFIASALEAYTPRALHALFTLTYKAQTLELAPPERNALDFLLLLAYDEGTSLEEDRPRSLKPHARYREKNLWLTLERLATDDANMGGVQLSAALLPLPDLLARREAAVTVFDGSVRDLIKHLEPATVPLMISALPRRNAVLWTLSAFWVAWLWGESAAGSVRNFARRRRYDWAWHETALRASFSACHKLLKPSSRFVALLPEADPGFVGAALTAADSVDFDLVDFALRGDPTEAQFTFGVAQTFVAQTFQSARAGGHALQSPPLQTIRRRAEGTAVTVIRDRGEPVKWGLIISAAFVELARDHLLRAAVEQTATDPLEVIMPAVEAACAHSSQLVHLMAEESPRSGWWWLTDPAAAAEPLADRAERETARALAEAVDTHAVALERRVCAAFTGWLTPDSTLIRHCLESYGEEHHTVWKFRPEDDPESRAEDVQRIAGDLLALGKRLGYEGRSPREAEVEWREAGSAQAAYYFLVSDTAVISRFVYAAGEGRRVVVIPGGRAGLVQYKLGRNPRLRAAVEQGGWLFLKFRHVRRLLAEQILDRNAILTTLGLDPISEEGSDQLRLL